MPVDGRAGACPLCEPPVATLLKNTHDFLHHTVTKNVEGFGIRFNTTIRDNTLIRPHLYKESCSYRGLL